MISRVVNCWLFALVVLMSFCAWMQRDAAAAEVCPRRVFTPSECDTIANIGAGALWGYLQGLPITGYQWDKTTGDAALQCRMHEVVGMAYGGQLDGVHPRRYYIALYQECTRPLVEARLGVS